MDDQTLRDVFVDVFGIAPSQYVDELSPDVLEAWDSLSHVRLVSAIEEKLGLQFEMSEIMEMSTVGAIKQIVATKRGA